MKPTFKVVKSSNPRYRARVSAYGMFIHVSIEERRWLLLGWKRIPSWFLSLVENIECDCPTNPHINMFDPSMERWKPGTLDLKKRVNEFLVEFFKAKLQAEKNHKQLEEKFKDL